VISQQEDEAQRLLRRVIKYKLNKSKKELILQHETGGNFLPAATKIE
jgi:hypothetical protein